MCGDGTYLYLYVNAVLQNSANLPADSVAFNRLGIGGLYRTTTGNPIPASWLDEVAVYDFPLSQAQIQSHYNKGAGL